MICFVSRERMIPFFKSLFLSHNFVSFYFFLFLIKIIVITMFAKQTEHTESVYLQQSSDIHFTETSCIQACIHDVYKSKWGTMYWKHRKFPVCSFHGTMSSLSVRSLRSGAVMRADEDSRTGRFNFLRSLSCFFSVFFTFAAPNCSFIFRQCSFVKPMFPRVSAGLFFPVVRIIYYDFLTFIYKLSCVFQL